VSLSLAASNQALAATRRRPRFTTTVGIAPSLVVQNNLVSPETGENHPFD
jgi:hypothetical protein